MSGNLDPEQAWPIIIALYVACLTILTISLIIGIKNNWHRFRETTATHLTWSPLVNWNVLLAYRIICAVVSIGFWIVILVSKQNQPRTLTTQSYTQKLLNISDLTIKQQNIL